MQPTIPNFTLLSLSEFDPDFDSSEYELWETVKYKGVVYDDYQVSSRGRTKTNRVHGGGSQRYLPYFRTQSQSTNKEGYRGVNLSPEPGAKKARTRVHAVVLESFIGPKPEGFEGCHNDGNPSNNVLTNLRWDTRDSNQADRLDHGTDPRGEKHGSVKLTEEQVFQIRVLCAAGDLTQTQIGHRYGVSFSAVNAIHTRRNWAWLPDLPSAAAE